MDPFKVTIVGWLICLAACTVISFAFIWKALFRLADAADDHQWRLRMIESRLASHDDKPEGVYDEV